MTTTLKALAGIVVAVVKAVPKQAKGRSGPSQRQNFSRYGQRRSVFTVLLEQEIGLEIRAVS